MSGRLGPLLRGFATLLAAAAAGAAPAATPPPQDVPYPGTMTLAVDATDLDHRLFTIHETLPVSAGPLTLLLPRWLPGYHGPYGKASRMAGLVIHAGEQRLAWQRDPLEPHAFHVDVPAGATRLDIDFQHVNPLDGSSDGPTVTHTLLRVQWDGSVLYPAGYWSSRIAVAARLRVPPGWHAATALRDEADHLATPDAQGWLGYAPVSLERLVDSPVVAGAHYKRIELDPPGTPRGVALDLFADRDDALKPGAAQVDAHRRLVQQADRLFGSRHFRHHDLMLWQSDELGGEGVEHHESSENGVAAGYFDDWDKGVADRDLLPHEFARSWNGKFRRPADLWTPNFNEPMQNSLLWLYEGQTQFWGKVLAARSGLFDDPQAHDDLAETIAWGEYHVGRQWRPLQDTTNEATMADGSGHDWENWQRGEDYYGDGSLLWLDADMLIRQQTRGQRSLDDFARRFFGAQAARLEPLTYRFEDVVAALNEVLPWDWAGFVHQRLDAVGSPAPSEGLARSGWRLAWREKESDTARSRMRNNEKASHFAFSLGLTVADKDAQVRQVEWHSPAFAAGLAAGVKIIAVNAEEFKPERLAQAVTDNKDGQHPIDLLVKEGERYRTVRIDYRGGLRYPALERIPGQPDLLAKLLAPRP